MKIHYLLPLLCLCAAETVAQVGIGTTTPNSTLEVKGSIATGYRTFTTNSNALITDHVLAFTGTTAATLTLPTAVGISGRSYQVKNASLTGPTPAVTIATTSSQTIDGLGNWSLTGQYQSVTLVSNGANWNVVSSVLPASAVGWSQTGNSNINAATNFLGTTDDKPLIFKSNAQSYLEFGKRQTLGLTQAYPDYSDGNEKVTFIRSALQFEADNAQFYKPKMYTDVNGNFRVKGSSAGTDFFEFGSTGSSNSGGFEFIIGDDGDEPIVFKSFHHSNGMSEIMRLQSGRMAVGSNAFNAGNPEKLLIDAGATTSYNLMTGKGSIDNYLQINVQNRSNGASASSDLVATADNGSETNNYVDLGINGSGYNGGMMGAANDAYLYNMGQNMLIGAGGVGKSLVFMTGGTTVSSNERMRIDGSGNIGVGVNNPAYRLHVSASSNPLFLGGLQTGSGADSVLTVSNGVVRRMIMSASGWSLSGNAGTNPTSNFIGTTDAQALLFKVNSLQITRYEQNSFAIGIGATTNNATYSGAIGRNAFVGYNKTNAYAIGTGAAVNDENSFSIGNGAITNAANAFALGNGAIANSAGALVFGTAATTAYNVGDALAIGNNATANAANSISIGSHSTAASKTITNASGAIALGTTSVNNATNAIAVGTATSISYGAANAIAVGNTASVAGGNSIAIGNAANVGSITNALALGAGASVTGTGANSTAIGYNASATKTNEIILGDRSNTALSVGIGSENFSTSNREKLLVETGASTSVNAIVGRGNNNNYLQLNIQNQNNGTVASSDVVATADNGTETTNYVDLGINSSGYSATGILGGANNAYLYTTGNDFVIGNSTNNKSLIFYTTTSSVNTERMRITNVGLVPGQDNTYSIGATASRWSSIWSVNGVVQTSDRRLKTNIKPLQYGLKEVLALQPVRYDWKDKSGQNKIGLIAQDVRKLVPEVVTGTESTDNLGMNYAELVPVLINAIKDQQQQINKLKAELESLKNK